MAYARQNFQNGNVLLAEQLNHIEVGILALESAAVTHTTQTLTDDEKKQARENIDALYSGDFNTLSAWAQSCANKAYNRVKENFVAFTESQSLTDEQKAQARANIGALDESVQQDIDYLRQDMDQGVFPVVNSAVTVNKQTLTDNQKAQARANIGAIANDDEVGGLHFVGYLTFDDGANIHLGDNVVHGVIAPEADTDAANKGYVDQAIANAIANLPVYNGEVEEV